MHVDTANTKVQTYSMCDMAEFKTKLYDHKKQNAVITLPSSTFLYNIYYFVSPLCNFYFHYGTLHGTSFEKNQHFQLCKSHRK